MNQWSLGSVLMCAFTARASACRSSAPRPRARRSPAIRSRAAARASRATPAGSRCRARTRGSARARTPTAAGFLLHKPSTHQNRVARVGKGREVQPVGDSVSGHADLFFGEVVVADAAREGGIVVDAVQFCEPAAAVMTRSASRDAHGRSRAGAPPLWKGLPRRFTRPQNAATGTREPKKSPAAGSCNIGDVLNLLPIAHETSRARSATFRTKLLKKCRRRLTAARARPRA